MATTTTTTNKPLNPRAQDLSPKGYNRANIFSGKALSFDGVNDRVELNTNVGTFTNITACWMVKTSSSGAFQNLFADGNGFFDCYILASGQFRIWFGGGYNTTSLPKLNDGNWNFLVMTREGSVGKIYVNGKLCETIAYPTANITINADALIGSNLANADWFNGQLSGVRVFNTALTPAQVSDLYLNPEKIVPDGVASSALKLWLPMMEGAGASAYDGSGNGNDGTINGATWTAGIGAPVAQTALVSWDKGTNLLTNSEQFSSVWVLNAASATANTATAPNGTTTADTIANNATNAAHRFYQLATAFSGTGLLSFSIRLKYKDHRYVSYGLTDDTIYRCQIVVDLQNGTIAQNHTDGGTSFVSSSIEDIGGGWYEVKATINATSAWGANLYGLGLLLNGSTFDPSGYVGTGTGVYVWGATANFGAAQPYIKTNATAQTSAVLVPEGLTAGASIFGTDIITPRNAFALNLDGASWGKVGANASFLFGTGAYTLEAWVKLRYINSGSYANEIISINDSDDSAVRTETTGTISFLSSTSRIAHSVSLNGDWGHVVALRESGGTTRLYLNGAQVASGTDAQNIPMTAGVRIGTDSTENARTYKDQLANPRIYNRALTAAEVLRNYNADKAKFGL